MLLPDVELNDVLNMLYEAVENRNGGLKSGIGLKLKIEINNDL
jgi:hypothetical protein